ncbi:MAG: GNAT family N-acetyltransferase [Bacteroidota bacterium]
MSPTVRRAAATDLDALAVLFDGYRRFYRQPSDLAGARRFLAERFEHGDSVIFVAALLDGAGLAGFTQLYPFFSSVRMRRVWILNDLFVAKDARRLGVAQALMDAAHAFAAETGAASVELATERTNTSAQALYDALGYERDDAFWHYALTLEHS